MAEYNKDLILAKIKQAFPNEEPEKILSILGRNDERTQLAVLKLSKGDLEELKRLLEAV